MNTHVRGCGTAHRSLRKVPVVAVMVLVGALAANQASAQIVVVDPTAIANNHADHALEYGKQVLQYAKQVEQHMTALESIALQYDQFTNLLVTLKNVPNSIAMPGAPLAHLDAPTLAQMQCATSDGSIFGGLMSSLRSAFASQYLKAQHQLCAAIVAVEVDKYNSTADMLDRIKGPGGYAELGHKLEAMRDSLGRLAHGDLASINDQAGRNLLHLNEEMSNWQAGIAAYDAMLKSMHDMQSTLANQALNGQPSLLGTSIQAAALAAALHVEE